MSELTNKGNAPRDYTRGARQRKFNYETFLKKDRSRKNCEGTAKET
jgi:hypothetical protein